MTFNLLLQTMPVLSRWDDEADDLVPAKKSNVWRYDDSSDDNSQGDADSDDECHD